MNSQHIENKVRQDEAATEKDLSTLEGDRAVRFGRFEADANQAVEKFTAMASDGVAQLGERLEKLTDEVKSTMDDVAATVKKDVEQGLNQYNLQAQAVADWVPGGFSQKAARYPWVTLSFALAAGFLLGSFIKPGRRSFGQLQI